MLYITQHFKSWPVIDINTLESWCANKVVDNSGTTQQNCKITELPPLVLWYKRMKIDVKPQTKVKCTLDTNSRLLK